MIANFFYWKQETGNKGTIIEMNITVLRYRLSPRSLAGSSRGIIEVISEIYPNRNQNSGPMDKKKLDVNIGLLIFRDDVGILRKYV